MPVVAVARGGRRKLLTSAGANPTRWLHVNRRGRDCDTPRLSHIAKTPYRATVTSRLPTRDHEDDSRPEDALAPECSHLMMSIGHMTARCGCSAAPSGRASATHGRGRRRLSAGQGRRASDGARCTPRIPRARGCDASSDVDREIREMMSFMADKRGRRSSQELERWRSTGGAREVAWSLCGSGSERFRGWGRHRRGMWACWRRSVEEAKIPYVVSEESASEARGENAYRDARRRENHSTVPSRTTTTAGVLLAAERAPDYFERCAVTRTTAGSARTEVVGARSKSGRPRGGSARTEGGGEGTIEANA